ncbi:tetratricopeptide repeat protein [Enterovirga aerilata]|uniref:Tetratricopeptide repeat protein n=1 Tax=Enterovirga aerilata TaxID=2730920 RepID=A0A849IC93_9HYPH|nr:tetratricopeptide repeat protein [Enterovirga sp. DB1703]NNM73660.1 tetratricopeptide repeat protein [Enterovirga sp. DB1703]
MAFTPPQPLAVCARLAGAGLLALWLGGCLGRGAPETTGSVASTAPVSESSLRQSSEALGQRFEANPGDAETAVAYAGTLRKLGQHAQAVAVLQQAAIRNPRTLSVLAAYGKALAEAGRLKEAQEVLAKAHLPERPDWRILSVQGTVADQLGDFVGAQRYYEAALRIVPGEPSVLTNQGLSYALAKRLPEGEVILRQAALHPRADGRVRQNLALVLGLQGKFGEAEAVLRQDMPPQEATQTLASIKRMVAQPNSWKALRQQAEVKPAAEKTGQNG